MDCNKCDYNLKYRSVAEDCGRVCGRLLLSGETVFIHDGKINQKCPKISDPSEADLKHLLSRTIPYIEIALADAEVKHDKTLELYFYEIIKETRGLLAEIELAVKG